MIKKESRVGRTFKARNNDRVPKAAQSKVKPIDPHAA
jgi:hypothetical protein